jgi:outer membrane protein W
MHVRSINIDPGDSSSALNVGAATLAGTGVSVDNGATIDVSLGYMLTDLSSSHDVNVFGLPAALNVPHVTKVIDTRVLPPTLF